MICMCHLYRSIFSIAVHFFFWVAVVANLIVVYTLLKALLLWFYRLQTIPQYCNNMYYCTMYIDRYLIAVQFFSGWLWWQYLIVVYTQLTCALQFQGQSGSVGRAQVCRVGLQQSRSPWNQGAKREVSKFCPFFFRTQGLIQEKLSSCPSQHLYHHKIAGIHQLSAEVCNNITILNVALNALRNTCIMHKIGIYNLNAEVCNNYKMWCFCYMQKRLVPRYSYKT